MNHTVVEQWMGQDIRTLEDLLRDELKAVCVGINPSPVSVEAGHYYQGRAGQRFFDRLRVAGVMPRACRGGEDDAAFAAGIGFTDIIKRPTASARTLTPAEFLHGREQLHAKLEHYRPQLVIFTFKRAAEVLFGRFAGNGFIEGLNLGRSQVFVMPGPYERKDTVDETMARLAERWRQG